MPEWRNLLLPQRDAGGGGNVAEALQRRASAQRAGIPAAGAVELDNCSLEAQKVTQQLLDARARRKFALFLQSLLQGSSDRPSGKTHPDRCAGSVPQRTVGCILCA